MNGRNGKILRVDLSDGSWRVETPDENFYRRYIGNGIMGAYYLLKETAPGLDAFDPANLLMFMSGAVGGLNAPGLARFVVSGKSPVTGGIGEARCEGPFALALKASGFDGIVIRGAAKAPCALVIEDGNVSIEDAKALWGKNVGAAADELDKRYPGAHTAIIGPAGENKVRFANVISDRCHEASRSGMGAVMGSKNLKAVVLKGGKLPEAADEAALKEFYGWFDAKMRKNVLSMWQYDRPGFGVWIHTHGIDASLGVNNYQSATCDYTDAYKPEAFDPFYKGEAACPGCPNNCIKLYAAPGDDPRASGLHQEAAGSFGPNLGCRNIETLVRANTLCNELGMDPNSLGYTISFAMECVQRGLLDPMGLNLTFSDDADVLKLVRMIARREGLGDMLAEGGARAAKALGSGAERYSMSVKGNEMTAFEARSQTNLALGFATAAVGPRYEICEHDWDFDTRVGWTHTLDYCRTIGILDRIPMEYLGEDKVHNFKALSTLWSAADGLGICLFATAPTRVYSLEDMARLVRSVTGWETSAYELMRVGELRYHMFRFYNCREGLTAKEDTLPDRFFEEPIDFGSHEGVKLDRATFERVIKLYYDMMGWDESGKPKASTLYDFGLGWLCEK